MLKEEFGRSVRNHRKEKGLTLESAAELCDISSKYLGRIERGGPSVGIDTIEKISKGLGVPVENCWPRGDTEKTAFTQTEERTAPFCKERQEEQ